MSINHSSYSDRLPWLEDDPEVVTSSARSLVYWSVAASLLVAGVSYSAGQRANKASASGEITIKLPPARAATVATPPLRDARDPEITFT